MEQAAMAKWDLCFVQLAQSNGAESDGVHIHTVYAYVNAMYFLLVSNSWLRLDCSTFGDVMQLHFGVELERRKQTQETASCSEWSSYSLNSNGSEWQRFITSCEKKDQPKALSTFTQRWREWLVNLRTIWNHSSLKKSISRISRISLDRGSNRPSPAAPTCQCQKLPGPSQLVNSVQVVEIDLQTATFWIFLGQVVEFCFFWLRNSVTLGRCRLRRFT